MLTWKKNLTKEVEESHIRHNEVTNKLLCEKEELKCQIDNMKINWYKDMKTISDLKLHIENNEMETHQQISNNQERLRQVQQDVMTKDIKILDLEANLVELKAERDRRNDIEINHLRFFEEIR